MRDPAKRISPEIKAPPREQPPSHGSAKIIPEDHRYHDRASLNGISFHYLQICVSCISELEDSKSLLILDCGVQNQPSESDLTVHTPNPGFLPPNLEQRNQVQAPKTTNTNLPRIQEPHEHPSIWNVNPSLLQHIFAL